MPLQMRIRRTRMYRATLRSCGVVVIDSEKFVGGIDGPQY